MPTRSDYRIISEKYPNDYIVGKENGKYRTFDKSAQFLINCQCGNAYYNGNGELGLTFNENDLPDELELQFTGEGSWYFIKAINNTLSAVIIACSRKNNGYCVAAYNPISKKIVRFVSDAETAGEISCEEMEGINLHDTVKAECIMSCPKGPQTENILVQPYGISRTVKFNGNIENIRQQIQFTDNVSILDKNVPRLKSVQNFHHSLEIVKVHDLKLNKKWIMYEKKWKCQIRAKFIYNDREYDDFRVTDPIYEEKLKKMDSHQMTIQSADIVLSIPWEPFEEDGMYYKFVAAIHKLSD